MDTESEAWAYVMRLCTPDVIAHQPNVGKLGLVGGGFTVDLCVVSGVWRVVGWCVVVHVYVYAGACVCAGGWAGRGRGSQGWCSIVSCPLTRVLLQVRLSGLLLVDVPQV